MSLSTDNENERGRKRKRNGWGVKKIGDNIIAPALLDGRSREGGDETTD